MNIIGLTTSTADRKRRAGQRMVVGLEGSTILPEERAFIHEVRPGGFVLFGRNIEEPRQVFELTRELRSLLPAELPPVLTVDQEGGLVQRIRAPATVWPPMRFVGNVGEERFILAVARALAMEIRACGFDLSFAPVCDVDSNPKNPVIGQRAFGSRAADVSRYVSACIRGFHAEGLMSCAKHFPGHGDTSVDSHLDLPVVEREPPQLDEVELPPFAAAIRAGVASVMTAHVVYPAWDEEFPATMSRRIVGGQLRERLRFGGVVFSDDMEMKAVRGRYPLDMQLRLASAAGVDSFLFCKELPLAVEGYEQLVRLQESGKVEDDHAVESERRWNQLRERFFLNAPPRAGLEVLGHPEHQILAARARMEGAQS